MSEQPTSLPAYFSPAEQARRDLYERRQLLFKGSHQSYYFPSKPPRYQYLTANWLGMLPETWSRLLFANFPEISAPADAPDGAAEAVSDLVADLELSALCRTSATQASWAGCAVWKATFSKAQQRVVLRQVDPVRVTWEMDPDDPYSPIAASYWFMKETRGPDGKTQQFLIRERQALIPRSSAAVTVDRFAKKLRLRRADRVRQADLQLAYDAYRFITKSTSTGEIYTIPKVETATMDEAYPDGDAPKDTKLAIDALTLIYIPNRSLDGVWGGESDFTESLVSLQSEVNDRASLNKHILDAHSKPTLLIPEDIIQDGMVHVEDLDWLTAKQDGNGRVMYVEWSGELGASFSQLDWLWAQFNAIAGLSTTMSGASSAVTGRAKEMELVAPIAEVKARRPAWEDAIQRAIYVAMALEKANGLSKIEPVRAARTVWPTVLPDSRTEAAQVTAVLMPVGAISIETAIRLNNPTWVDAEVFAEIARIEADDDRRMQKASAAAEAQAIAQQALADHQHQLTLDQQENQARLQGQARAQKMSPRGPG
jgi:hypothetical protein